VLAGLRVGHGDPHGRPALVFDIEACQLELQSRRAAAAIVLAALDGERVDDGEPAVGEQRVPDGGG
jgi:hypothetical protein